MDMPESFNAKKIEPLMQLLSYARHNGEQENFERLATVVAKKLGLTLETFLQYVMQIARNSDGTPYKNPWYRQNAPRSRHLNGFHNM